MRDGLGDGGDLYVTGSAWDRECLGYPAIDITRDVH